MAPLLTLILLLLSFLASVTLLLYSTGGENYGRAISLIYDILRHPSKAYDTITTRLKSYGGTVHSTYMLVTSDPRNVDHVFNKRHSQYPKGPEFKERLDFLGDGIINQDGELGLYLRRILHSLISSPQYETLLMTTLVRKIESGLLPALDRASDQGLELDMQDVFKRLMFDNASTTVLGFDPCYLTADLLPDAPFASFFDQIEERVLYRHLLPDACWKFQRLIGIGEERKYRKALEKFDLFVNERIQLGRESFNKTKENPHFDLLTSLVAAAEQKDGTEEMGGLRKSDKFIRDMTVSVIAAGRDTVSATLTWLLWLIASNPNVEGKILQEIRENLGENLMFIREEELSKLVYLHGAVCEALRLYTPIPFEMRTALEADTLPSGHKVGKNARVYFSIYSMGRMEEIWGKDWMEFKPERWIDSEGKKFINVPAYKFAAFSVGPRLCVGKKSSFVYVKQVMSALIYNYKVEIVEGHPVAPAISMIMFMEHGLKVRVSKRR